MRRLKHAGRLLWIGVSASLVAVGSFVVLGWVLVATATEQLVGRYAPGIAMLVALFHGAITLCTLIPKRAVRSTIAVDDRHDPARDDCGRAS